jgi:hypothetical protein
MAAYVIRTGPDLSASDAALAGELGPSMVGSTEPVEDLMASAGFDDVQARDVTDALARSCETILAFREVMEAELRAEEGDAAFEEERATKEGMLEAVRRGLLRRTLIVGRSPATV